MLARMLACEVLVRVTSNEHLGQEIPRHLPPLTFMHSCCRCSITREQSDFKISRYSSSQYGRNHPQSRQSTTNLFDNPSSPLCVISTLFSSIPYWEVLTPPRYPETLDVCFSAFGFGLVTESSSILCTHYLLLWKGGGLENGRSTVD
jgi:hypothetical protein